MITGVKKFSIFLILTFGLIVMSLIFPHSQAYAGEVFVFDFLYDTLTGGGNIEDELFEQVIEDTVIENINIIGFDTHRFETEEQAAKFRAAVFEQQIKNLREDLKNASPIGKAQILLNLKDHASSNLSKSVDQVNKLIEEKGGNIDLVELELENFNIFGYAVGKKFINMFKDVTPDDYENLRKLDKQLMKEAYAELGVADLPQDILEGLFEMSNNQEAFIENFKNMSQSDREWFEKTKAYYAYSAKLTDDAIDLMEAAGLSNLDELRQFYINNKHQIRNMDDLKKLTESMKKDRQNLLDLLKHATPVDTKEALKMSGNPTKGCYIVDSGVLSLYAFPDNNGYQDISIYGTFGGLKFDTDEEYKAFMTAWKKFKQKYNWQFTQKSPNFQRLFTFYQPGDLDDPIELAGKIDVEYHTFVSKVIFKITKKKGTMSDIDVADMAKLNEVALKYNTKFAKVYKRLTGNASPVPKVTKTGDSVIVELDYYKGIEDNNSRVVYDAIRNNWSLIVGKHKRPSLDYRNNGSNEGFVPTIAFKNVKERGVYEVEAIVFGSRFYQYEDSYTRYVNCWTFMGYHCHGTPVIVEYFPYREEVQDPVHGLPRDNDQRNIAPDHIVKDKVIAKAIWEVNVSEKGEIIIPVVGVRTSTDIKISNFITR